MRSITKRTFLLRESPTRKIDTLRERLVREKKNIYLLSTGQPSIPPPIEVREYAMELLKEESMRLYGYTPSQGILELREAIAEDLKRLGNLDVDPSNIVVTAGGQGAMFSTLAAIVEEGDEVILTDPTYFGYKPILEYFGAKIRYTKTSLENGFQPDIEDVKSLLTSRTKAIVIVTPENPTGRILSEETAKALADLAIEKDFYIVVDEAYKTIIYEGKHVWFWKYAPEHTIGVNAFSKDPGIPGWRLGYVYAPTEVVRAVKLVNEETVYCPPSIAQYMVTYYLRNNLRSKYIPKVLKEYRERRDVMLKTLQSELPEARVLVPSGSMFMFPDLSSYLARMKMDSDTFAEKLISETGVAVIPGSYFGSTVNYIRLSFVTETPERIVEAMELMADFIRKYS